MAWKGRKGKGKKKNNKKKTQLGKPSIGRNPKQSVYLFKRTFVQIQDLGAHPTENPTISGVYAASTSGTSNTSWTISPKIILKDLPNYSEFQGLFTQYKLQGIKTRFYLTADPATAPVIGVDGQPLYNSQSGNVAYYNQPFLMDSWFNPTEILAPATEDAVLQIQRRRTRVLRATGVKNYCKLKQHIDLSLGSNTAALEYNAVARNNKWIPLDDDYLEVPHYGATYWVRALTNTGVMSHMSLRMEHTVYISTRGAR
jgi:hypothetical protein